MNSPTQTNEANQATQSTIASGQEVSVTICPTVIPQGDGSFLIKAGKPVTRLTAPQLAAVFSVDRDTIYRWRNEGKIPRELVELCGARKLSFRVEAVEVLRLFFQAKREDEGMWPVFQNGARSARMVGSVHGFVVAKPHGKDPFLVPTGIWERDWKPVSSGRKK